MRVYQALKLPVWTVHGHRGDFVEFREEREVAVKPNRHFAELDTGAMPQFERLDELVASYDHFLIAWPEQKAADPVRRSPLKSADLRERRNSIEAGHRGYGSYSSSSAPKPSGRFRPL